jgi:hypothetical protein
MDSGSIWESVAFWLGWLPEEALVLLSESPQADAPRRTAIIATAIVAFSGIKV